jgi:hypothetical protein
MDAATQFDLSQGRTIANVIRDLNTQLKAEGVADNELFGDQTAWDANKAKTLPARWSWLACYPVRGNSEGYYVHIDMIHTSGQRTLIGLTKVWNWEKACRLANGAARILCEV